MSSFTCPHCHTPILDSPSGYITGCEHFPRRCYVCGEPLQEGETTLCEEHRRDGLQDILERLLEAHEPKETVA